MNDMAKVPGDIEHMVYSSASLYDLLTETMLLVSKRERACQHPERFIQGWL